MLGEVFYWVFNMSISATVAGAVILLLGKIKKLPRRFCFCLWIIPFFRFLFPIGLGSKYSLMSLISKVTTKTVVVYSDTATFSMTNHVMAADSYFPIIYKVNLLENIFGVTSVIWLLVSVVILFLYCILYWITKTQLRDAVHLCDNVYLSDKIQTPAVYGIIKPRILMPLIYKDKDLSFIVAHEKAHIRRADNMWRMIALLTAALHWFNPFVWLFLKRFLTDMELSCDEMILTELNEDEQQAYATMLVDCAESKNAFASAFGGAKIRARIANILSYRKLSLFSALCFFSMAIIIAYILLTNAL